MKWKSGKMPIGMRWIQLLAPISYIAVFSFSVRFLKLSNSAIWRFTLSSKSSTFCFKASCFLSVFTFFLKNFFPPPSSSFPAGASPCPSSPMNEVEERKDANRNEMDTDDIELNGRSERDEDVADETDTLDGEAGATDGGEDVFQLRH